MVRKPDGVAETESLLQKLVQVPKQELDRELEKAKAKPKPKKRAPKRKK